MTFPLVLHDTARQFTTHVGIDSPQHATSIAHFNDYKKLVVYHYNSLGYRDNEWPDDISNQIWSIGDSFTVGLGQPIHETWPNLIQEKLQRRVINVSMNGASNDWIARRVEYILANFNPCAIFVQWSYLHRREHPDATRRDEERALNYIINDTQDVENFIKNLNIVESKKKDTIIVHSFIPNFFESPETETAVYIELTQKNSVFFIPPKQVDFSRDGYHYDVLTATAYADLYILTGKL